jgi:ribokinase
MSKKGIAILGIYVADLVFRAPRQPIMGETLIGTSFFMGPGGKGSNQAVAAARAGAEVAFITKLGKDNFGDAALALYVKENITAYATQEADISTGAAYIFLEDGTGSNAIIVVPGAAGTISIADINANAKTISNAKLFMTQLEQPIPAAVRALEIAKAAGTITIFNPAPAAPLDDSIYHLCDFVTPNETEAAMLTGITVSGITSAKLAAQALLDKGAGAALITLGGQGALLHSSTQSIHIPIHSAGPVVDTSGAGDAFNGGFAAALASGQSPEAAAHFGSAVAGLSVTRPGTAASMPTLAEVLKLMGN